MFYGRNFDWDFSPALLLFTNPPDGYASVSRGDLDRAISDYDKVIELSPHSAEAFYNRGIAYTTKGDPENAIADFIKVLELCGNDTTLCQNAQQKLQQLGGK
jgi:Flp pilus assembly protein TadD